MVSGRVNFANRRKVWIGALAFLGIAILLIGFVGWIQHRRAAQQVFLWHECITDDSLFGWSALTLIFRGNSHYRSSA